MTPAEVLTVIRGDETAPRLTFYDDEPGPTRGERIELSAKVLANWVAKAGNLLQEEFDAGPGTAVGLDLPAHHWRTLYWALAAWSVGATVRLDDPARADVVVTDNPREDTGDGGTAPAQLVVVTLASLARMCPNPLPSGAIDEAADLLTYADHFDAWDTAADGDVALIAADGRQTAYGDLVPEVTGAHGRRVYLEAPDGADLLLDALRVWAADGSIVIVRDPDPTAIDRRLESEGASPERA